MATASETIRVKKRVMKTDVPVRDKTAEKVLAFLEDLKSDVDRNNRREGKMGGPSARR